MHSDRLVAAKYRCGIPVILVRLGKISEYTRGGSTLLRTWVPSAVPVFGAFVTCLGKPLWLVYIYAVYTLYVTCNTCLVTVLIGCPAPKLLIYNKGAYAHPKSTVKWHIGRSDRPMVQP